MVIDQVLQQQNHIPAVCQCLHSQERSNTKQQNILERLILLQDQQRFDDPDQWPLGDWLHKIQSLQHSLYNEQPGW